MLAMKEITEALAAKHDQIKKLQHDIDALQRAAGILSGGKVKAKTKTKTKAKAKRTRPTMNAAGRKAVSKRMKAYWAKQRKAKG